MVKCVIGAQQARLAGGDRGAPIPETRPVAECEGQEGTQGASVRAASLVFSAFSCVVLFATQELMEKFGKQLR